MLVPDCKGVPHIQMANLRGGPERGVSGHDVARGRGCVLLIHVAHQGKPRPCLVLGGLPERKGGPGAMFEIDSVVESGAEKCDYRVARKLVEGWLGPAHGFAAARRDVRRRAASRRASRA